MRLYSLTNASAIDDPQYGHFEPDPGHGGFDLPDELADHLHSVHLRKRKAWETDTERDDRRHGEERDRRRDPETLYNAVADIATLAKQLTGTPQAAGLPPEVAAELAELRRQIADLQAAAAPQDAGDSPGASAEASPDAETAPARPSRARK